MPASSIVPDPSVRIQAQGTGPPPYAPRTVLLANGTVARVRTTTPEDRSALLALHRGASDNSIYLRFFSVNRAASDSFVDRVCTVSAGEWSLVAEQGRRIVGIATAAVESPGRAEVALLVDEQMHGLGIGTLLLEHLAEWSATFGVSSFSAEVLAGNVSMLRVFHDAGFVLDQQRDHEVMTVTMDIRPSAASLAASGRRERVAEKHSLAPLLEPASMCVVGVSRSRGRIGREVLENVLAGGYTGTVTAVGRLGLAVAGATCVTAVDEVPPGQDLAVLALPAEQLEGAVRSLGERGTRTCVVLTSGLGEATAAGQQVERRLAELAADLGMRLVGPNCFGVLSNLRDTRLNATFARDGVAPGTLAVGSQSGGVGVTVLEASRARGSGLACFVSIGNKVDVSGNDLLSAWSEDPDVRAAALYLESFLDPRKFARVAAVFSRHKPLLVAFGGTSSAGLRAGASHTAASATPLRALRALFRTAGVVAVDDVEDLVDTAALLTEQPLPRGPRLGIIGNAGGLGILAADAAQRAGLEVPELAQGTRRTVSRLGTIASAANPVDLGAGAGPDFYRAALEALIDSGDVDAVLVLAVATAVTDLGSVRDAVSRVAEVQHGLPVLAVATAGGDSSAGATMFRSPEAAVRALAHALDYASWRRDNTSDPGAEVTVDGTPVAPATARSASHRTMPSTTEGWLSADEAAELVSEVDGVVPALRVVSSADEAVRAAADIGCPVVVKAAAGEFVHKSEARLVRTGLRDERDVRAAASDLLLTLGDGAPLLVQQQVSGPEIAIGLTRDPRFGPLTMVASGGVNLELWQDQVFLMSPLRRSEILDALHSLRTWPLLDGFRGAAPIDVDALARLVESIGRLAEQRPEVVELDLNPVVCTPSGPVCVDVKVRTTRRLDGPATSDRTTSKPGPVALIEHGPADLPSSRTKDAARGRARGGAMSTQERTDSPAPASDTRHRIIVGVEDTAQPSGPLLWACHEADRRHAAVRVVSAFPVEAGPSPTKPSTHPGTSPKDSMRASLTELTRKVSSEVAMDPPLVRPGAPARVLTDAVDEGTLMVVVGRHAHARLEHAVLGSTSRAVAGRSRVPAVVIPDRWVPARSTSAPVVVGVRGDDRDERVLRFAFERAAALHVPLIAVHSWEIPYLLSWSPSEIASARARVAAGLDQHLAPWRAEFPDVEVVTGTPAERPVDAVLDAGHVAQLMVVGRHVRDAHHVGPRLGSTVRGVLHRAEVPVAVVPTGGVEHEPEPSSRTSPGAWGPTY